MAWKPDGALSSSTARAGARRHYVRRRPGPHTVEPFQLRGIMPWQRATACCCFRFWAGTPGVGGASGLRARSVAIMLRVATRTWLKVFSHLNDWFEEFGLYYRLEWPPRQRTRRPALSHPLRSIWIAAEGPGVGLNSTEVGVFRGCFSRTVEHPPRIPHRTRQRARRQSAADSELVRCFTVTRIEREPNG